LAIIIAIVAFLGFKIIAKKRREKQVSEEREDNVFYDAVKNIRKE
jgi:hypothetical protein